MNIFYGVFLSTLIGLCAFFLSSFLSLGSVVLAIVFGAVISNSVKIAPKFDKGISFSEKTLLALAISLLGIHLDFGVLFELGFNTIIIIVLSLILTIAFTLFLSKRNSFDKKFALILGIGNAICGSAAIATTKDIVGLDKEKTAISIAIINFLGTIALFVLPIVGVLLSLTDTQMGVLLGNTLQSVGHAVAAGFSVNDSVGQSATIVKMGRILLLTPAIFWLIYFVHKNDIATNSTKRSKVSIPYFIYGFVFFSFLATLGIIPETIFNILSFIGKFSLIIAMSAIGLRISFNSIKNSGLDALILASYIFIFQIVLSIVLVGIFI